MSDPTRLGASDAAARWIGIRRHQALAVVSAAALIGQWTLTRSHAWWELALGLVTLALAAPAYDALTLGEVARDAVRFASRAHWFEVGALRSGDDLVLWAGGEVSVRVFALVHRGRLDLAGRDVHLVQGLAGACEALGAGRGHPHASLHVLAHGGERATKLALPAGAEAPEGWRVDGDGALALAGHGRGPTSRLLERWSYLRTPDGLVRTYRVRDFSSVPASRSLLERFARGLDEGELALHVEVVAGERAQRVAARAVHAVGSDAAASNAAGFRRSARTLQHAERLAHRESLVAGGRALVRLAVFVVIRAESLEELRSLAMALWRRAHASGLRLERGWGRQGAWYCQHLPGGLNW